MSEKCNILIIGAGLIGLSIADSLLARGEQVTVLEGSAGPGQGAGQYNSAMVHPSQVLPWAVTGLSATHRFTAARTLYPLATLSAARIFQNMQRLSLPDQFRKKGIIQIFKTRNARAAAQANYKVLGIAYTLRAAEIGARSYPALFFGEDFSGDPWVYCQALAAHLDSCGADIIYNSPVRLDFDGGKIAAQTADGRTFRAKHIVLAAGANSLDLAQNAGLELPIFAVKGHAMSFKRSEIEKAGLKLPQVPVMHAGSHSTLTSFDNELRLSGTVGQRRPESLLRIWEKILPELKTIAPVPFRVWSAERPLSRLGRPIMGQTQIKGLWAACGHGHMGWTLCAASGEVMADQIANGQNYNEFAVY